MPGEESSKAGSDTPGDPTGLRQFVFGDVAMDEWPPSGTNTVGEPWITFVRAREALRGGAEHEAASLWRQIASMSDIESRHTLQAWHFLRSVGVLPLQGFAKRVYGAVAEVSVPSGHDLLAVYADGSVRYLNSGGAAVIIDEHIASVEAPAAELLRIGQSIVNAIGPWDQPLPPLPAGYSRLTLLTPIGPHFGQGPDAALRADPAGAAFFDAATSTLVAVVALGER